MGKYCLVKHLSEEFKKRLKKGEINPEKLAEMTSKERHEFFKGFLGDENATNVNSLFEKKLLQKNRWNAMINWAKETTGIKPEVRRDLLTRIEKMSKEPSILSPESEEAFLQDLASTKLGIDVNFNEAKNITDLTNKMVKLREKTDPKTMEFASKSDRLDYGLAKVLMQDYVKELKIKTEQKGIKKYLTHPLEIFDTVAGTMKSIVASLDNSFFGRQGIKVLYTKPSIWMKNFYKSFGDIGKELAGVDAVTPIKADIFSRPNALNGTYQRMKLDIGIASEEAFPSQLPEKIPLLKRLYKASESAYNGAALRMRADLADHLVAIAEKQGVDITEKVEAESIGKLINSTTGRGGLKMTPGQSRFINVALFSVKFLKSNVDTVTAHALDRKMSKFAHRQAQKNLLKIMGSVTTILGIADYLYPGSVEKDPRSSDFGKIKIGNTRFDVTGGMGSLVTLFSRLLYTPHNGEWGFWTKSSTTGKYTKLGTGKYGSQTPIDVLQQFAEGKLSPFAGLLRDKWKGETFEGKPLTPKGVAYRSLVPISVQTWKELKDDPQAANIWVSMVADLLGISTSTYAPSKTDWEQSESKELLQFKERVGQEKFAQANEEYNTEVSRKVLLLKDDNRYKSLSDDDKARVMTKLKDNVKSEIFKKYKFKYSQAKKTKEIKEKEKQIKELTE